MTLQGKVRGKKTVAENITMIQLRRRWREELNLRWSNVLKYNIFNRILKILMLVTACCAIFTTNCKFVVTVLFKLKKSVMAISCNVARCHAQSMCWGWATTTPNSSLISVKLADVHRILCMLQGSSHALKTNPTGDLTLTHETVKTILKVWLKWPVPTFFLSVKRF